MTVSQDYRRRFYAQSTDSVIIILIELTSDELNEPIFLSTDPTQLLPVENVYGTISNGQNYIFLKSEISLPTDRRQGSVRSTITFDNVDQSIVGHLRSVSKPVNVNMKLVLSNDPDVVEKDITGFELSNVSYDLLTIEGEMTLDYWDLEPFPSVRFTPNVFPGLF